MASRLELLSPVLGDTMNSLQATRLPPWNTVVLDMNMDGQLTLTDVGPLLTHIFFLPGDCLLWLVFTYSPGLLRLLNLQNAAFGSVESAALSVAGWLFAILVLVSIHSMLVRLKYTIIAAVLSVHRELLRRTRVGKALLSYRLRRLKTRPNQEASEVIQEVTLDDRDLDVLSLHGNMGSESALTIREIAERIGVSRREAQRTVEKLKSLELLDNRIDEKGTYKLTRPGEMFLVSRTLLST